MRKSRYSDCQVMVILKQNESGLSAFKQHLSPNRYIGGSILAPTLVCVTNRDEKVADQ